MGSAIIHDGQWDQGYRRRSVRRGAASPTRLRLQQLRPRLVEAAGGRHSPSDYYLDVLFESAADAYAGRLIGILLTGANDDGARGLGVIKAAGGQTVAQTPETAMADTMPRSAITAGVVDHVLAPPAILDLLLTLTEGV